MPEERAKVGAVITDYKDVRNSSCGFSRVCTSEEFRVPRLIKEIVVEVFLRGSERKSGRFANRKKLRSEAVTTWLRLDTTPIRCKALT